MLKSGTYTIERAFEIAASGIRDTEAIIRALSQEGYTDAREQLSGYELRRALRAKADKQELKARPERPKPRPATRPRVC